MKKLFTLLAFVNCLSLLKANDKTRLYTEGSKNSSFIIYHSPLNTDVAQKIKGTIIDGTDGKTPIEFATVALQNKTTNKVIDGATTDAKGEFVISNVAEGSYKIVISFVGFSDKTLEDIKVTGSKTLDMGFPQICQALK